jgi:hypothetical protein
VRPTETNSNRALRGIRKALENNVITPLPSFAHTFNAWIHANVARRERAKFKSFLRAVEHLADVDLNKARRRVGVSKDLLDKWINTPKTANCIKYTLGKRRRLRAGVVVGWVKFNLKILGGPMLKAPIRADGELHPDGIDYGNMLPWAKQAADFFTSPKVFRKLVESALVFHECGGLSSAKQFFIDLGKCLSCGTRGTRGIKPGLWDKLDVDIADILLSYDPPMSDKDAVRELQNRGHFPREHLQTLEVRFRKRKQRLIQDAHAFLIQASSNP